MILRKGGVIKNWKKFERRITEKLKRKKEELTHVKKAHGRTTVHFRKHCDGTSVTINEEKEKRNMKNVQQP